MLYHPESPTDSLGGELPVRDLLFGEIDTTGSKSLHASVSRCNLTLSSSSTFLRFWLLDAARQRLLEHLDPSDLAQLRLVCHDFGNRVAPKLFDHVHVNFRSSTFGRPARTAALDRIGRFVRTLTFSFPHSDSTALPPLIHPVTGEEHHFVYTPQAKVPHPSAEKSTRSKFGSAEAADLLVKQYPPIFHAATNVPSFIRAFRAMPNMSHLRISCPTHPAQPPARRNAVDYALISLRIAVERAPLIRLDTLSLLPIHPSGLFYLQPLMGIGACPSSARRWAQIRSMTVQMQSLDADAGARRDHLRSLHQYLRNFASSLHKFSFRWSGERGPSPLTLASEPCFNVDAGPQFKKPNYSLKALRFTALNHMELHNAVMDAAQVNAFICEHKKTLEEFKFEQVQLRTGDWEQALSPLFASASYKSWKGREMAESMDVPIMLGPECSARVIKEELVDGIGIDAANQSQKTSTGFSNWLSRSSVERRSTVSKAKEHLSMLKNSVFTWR